MARTLISHLAEALERAYRGDRWHSLRRNLEPVTPAEWETRPGAPSEAVFGPDPELSIADIVCHVGAAKRMYANRAFGDGSATWSALAPPRRGMTAVLGWLDGGHDSLAAGLADLEDDRGLAVERVAHWGEAIPRERFVSLMVSHDLYHAGEINRQLALLRGASGWETGRSH